MVEDSVDAVVIGAGVIGLAVAREIARSGREVLVLEEQDSVGTQTSSRNSEVIHAGIYYRRDSLKARMCVAGRELLYRYCADRDIPHRRIGKLIVATDETELPILDTIRGHAEDNGVDDLRHVGTAELRDLEPELDCAGALLSPSTGIVDAHALMRALHRDVEDAGGAVVFRSRVAGGAVAGRPRPGRFTVDVDGVGTLACSTLVNCAGLGAWDVARSLAGLSPEAIPARHLAKGTYFALGSGSAPFERLVYPVPVDGGLGVHLTLDLGGQARFGPDVQWVDTVDYAMDGDRADAFTTAIRRYWPGLPDGALHPDYAGIRPKVTGRGDPAGDFVIQGADDHGHPGLVNLFGIESPGLTSALAIATEAVRMATAR